MKKERDFFQIKRVGLSRNILRDWYHTLMRISWTSYFILFALSYLAINSFFGLLYYMGGDSILNANPKSYWDAWIFSFQTSSTLGYGFFLPKTVYAHFIVVFDLLSGILFVALATGMAFARFSKPTSRVLFTENMILTNFDGDKSLIFRLGNARSAHIVDANINVVAVIPEITKEGHEMRRLRDLKLLRSHSPLFTLSWTVIHKIDESSPLFGLSLEDIHKKEISFVVSFTGIEDVFSQSVHSRNYYSYESIKNAKRFEDILITNEKGERIMNYHNFHKLID